MDPALAPGTPPKSVVFQDGLGERRRIADVSGADTIELLCLRGELTAIPAFEFALRERASRLANFRHIYYGRVRSVDRLNDATATLAVVSDSIKGVRLSNLLVASERRPQTLDINASLHLIRQLVSAVAMLHETARDVAHGAIGPERIIVTPNARVVIVEYVLGAALEQLHFSHERYWRELRIALPPSPGLPRFDHRADVTQVGAVALALMLGRLLHDDEYPGRIGEVLAEAYAINSKGVREPLPQALRTWIARSLQLDPRHSFASALEARDELDRVLSGEEDEEGAEAVSTAAPPEAARYETPAYEPPKYEAPRYETPKYEAPKYEAPKYEAPRYDSPKYETPKYEAPTYEALTHDTARFQSSSFEQAGHDAPAAAPRFDAPAARLDAPTSAPAVPLVKPEPQAATRSFGFEMPKADPSVVKPEPSIVKAEPPVVRPAPVTSTVSPQAAIVKPEPVASKSPAVRHDPPVAKHEPFVFDTKHDDAAEEHEEHEAERPSKGRSWNRVAVAAGVALIVLAGAGVYGGRRYLASTSVAATTGTLSISSNPPGAQVAVDGQVHGVTPLTVTLKAGSHVVELRGAGEPRAVPVTITAGAQASQYIELPKNDTAFGQLQIRTEPAGANVTVDGIPRGKSPVLVESLAAGDHAVVLQSETATVKQSVAVEAGQVASLVVPLTAAEAVPTSGWISVAAPVELQLYENKRLIGTSQSERLMLPAGKHDIEMVNETLGFRAVRSVQVPAGRVAPVKLEWPKGTIAINALPWAEVYIDGEKVGETPIGNLSLSIGPHEILFRHPDLGEQKYAATVSLKTPARVSVDLRKK